MFSRNTLIWLLTLVAVVGASSCSEPERNAWLEAFGGEPAPTPDSEIDITPPEIVGIESSILTGVFIHDGATDVKPFPLNAYGIDIYFNELISADSTCSIHSEDGTDLGWETLILSTDLVLTDNADAVSGVWLYTSMLDRYLHYETGYQIRIAVKDRSGNELATAVTFVTSILE